MTTGKPKRGGCGGCGGGMARAVAHGAVGLTKAALRIDRPPDEVIEARLAKCRTCDKAERREYKGALIVTTLSRCLGCHDGAVPCFIAAKARIVTEICPLGLWQFDED